MLTRDVEELQPETTNESEVIAWWRELVGFPPGAGGLLVSGASIANLMGLAAARDARAGFDVRRLGLRGGAGGRLMFYASTEACASVRGALELLGIGYHCLRSVPAGEDGRIDLTELRDRVTRDRCRGDRPAVVIANAGTASTGGIDDLSGLAALCRGEHLWLHVDGALGVLAWMSPRLRPLVAGLEEADSLAFDLREWMLLPYGAGCVLARRAEDLRAAFAVDESSGGSYTLEAWKAMMLQGVEQHVRLLERSVDQARNLAARIDETPELERLAPASLNVVCFRYRADLPEEKLEGLNREILKRLQGNGVAISGGVTQGRFGLRAVFTPQQSFEALVEEAVRVGRGASLQ